MTGMLQDLRYAVRQFLKTPGLTILVIVTIGLGVGANTALFSVVNGVLLSPLPYPEPDQLVALRESKPNFEWGTVPYPKFRDWQKDNHTFSKMAVWRSYAFSLTGVGEAEQVNAHLVSSDFFPILGVKPILGRNFLPGEDEIGAAPIAVITESLWRRKFASVPDIVGKGITLDGTSFTIVGVIPNSPHFPMSSASVRREVFVPIGQWKNNLLTSRSAGLGINGIGRLKPGVTIQQARADMANVTNNLAAAFPDASKGTSAKLIPLKQWMVGDIGSLLLVLARQCRLCAPDRLRQRCKSSARAVHRPYARVCGSRRLGGEPEAVVRQLLTESLLLALAGGALGLVLAGWGTRAALRVSAHRLCRALRRLAWMRECCFSHSAISVLAGVLFGLAPAFRLSIPKLQESLKEGGRGA